MDENALIFRTPWNAFPDITVQTTVGKLKSHPDYHAAKGGKSIKFVVAESVSGSSGARAFSKIASARW